MKKIVLLAAVAGLALAGCSGSEEAESGSTETAVTVTDAYIPQPASDTSAMFGTVANAGSDPVTLLGGSAPDVGMVQVHEFVKEGNKEVMRQVPGGLEVPAGGSVELKPGSYHVMLMNVTADWTVGDEIPVTLNLSNGDTVEVVAPVKAREGMDADSEGDGDMEMGMEESSS